MVKKFNIFIVILLSLFFSAVSVKAQVAENDGQSLPVENAGQRPNLMRELGLPREQIQQVRRVMQDRQPALRQAKQRLKSANEALDAAIYSDDPNNESEIQARLREVQAAHGDLIRNRTESERAVRQILTVEQLGRFRSLRGQFRQPAGNDGNLINRRQNRVRSGGENLHLRRPRMGRRNP